LRHRRKRINTGFRINTAEPAATVCGNIVCTGIFSTWSNAYGVAVDNLVNAEFVDYQGSVFNLADRTAPNLFAFRNEMLPPPPAICTKAYVKMYPTTDDEEGLIVPFARFDDAVLFCPRAEQKTDRYRPWPCWEIIIFPPSCLPLLIFQKGLRRALQLS